MHSNLLIGDMLPITEYSAQTTTALAQAQIPSFTQNWEIAVMYVYMAHQIFH